jgi:DNA repair exonuclease SbcCD ATPase subunit
MPTTKLITHLSKLSDETTITSLSPADEALIEIGQIDAQGDQSGRTALHGAVVKNQPIWVRKLLDLGAKLNIKDKKNKTALQLAKETQDPIMIEAINSADDKMGKKSPMMHIINDKTIYALERMESLRKYLEQGYDINYATSKGITLLHLTVSYQVLNAEMLKLFQKYGVDINAKDSVGRAPIDVTTDERFKNLLRGKSNNNSSSPNQVSENPIDNSAPIAESKKIPVTATSNPIPAPKPKQIVIDVEKPTLHSLNKQIEDEQTRLKQAQEELAAHKKALADLMRLISTSLAPKQTQFNEVNEKIGVLLTAIKGKDAEIADLQARKASVIERRRQLLEKIQLFAKAQEARNKLVDQLGDKTVELQVPQAEPANNVTAKIDTELAERLQEKETLTIDLGDAQASLAAIRQEILNIKTQSAEKVRKDELIKQSEAKVAQIEEAIAILQKKRDALDAAMREELKVHETNVEDLQKEIEKMMAELQEMAGVPAAQQPQTNNDDDDEPVVNNSPVSPHAVTEKPLMLSGHKRIASPNIARQQIHGIMDLLSEAIEADTNNNNSNKKPRMDSPSPR